MGGGAAHIAIAGLIGAGKTTFAGALALVAGTAVYHEPVGENPVLADFYADMPRWAFPMQMFLLDARAAQAAEVARAGGVQDRTLYEDAVFAEMLADDGALSAAELALYRAYVERLRAAAPAPDLVVFLDASPAACLARVRRRGRACEQAMPLAYLEKLHARYDAFVRVLSRTVPVARVPWDDPCITPELMCRVLEARAAAAALPRPLREPFLVTIERP